MIIFIFACVFGAIVILQLINVIKRRCKLPPGPICWPLIGNLMEITKANPVYPHLALAELAKKYGNIMGLGFGMEYSIVLSGYDEIKDILKKPQAVDRFEFPYAKDRSFNKLLGIVFTLGNDSWQEVRRFTVKGLVEFGFGKKSSMDAILEEETNVVVKDIRSSADSNNGIWDVEAHYLGAITLNILWSLVTGERFDHHDEAVQENLHLTGKVAKIISHNNVYNVYPFLKRFVPKLVNHDDHMKTHHDMQKWMKGLVDTIKAKRALRLGEDAQNFVELFLDEIEKNKGRSSNFTEEQLIMVLSDLFFAGGENMSITLMWTILYVTIHPEVQIKLQTEIKRAKLTSDTRITVRDAAKIPYLNAVILESFRLGNPVPMNFRMASEDFYYNKFLIPKGAPLHVNVSKIFMDEGIWGDPQTFRPDRFIDAAAGVVISEYAEKVHTVFGFGKRKCMGDVMARDSLKMLVIAIFENFTLEAIPGKEPSPVDPVCRITIQPRSYSVRVVKNKIL